MKLSDKNKELLRNTLLFKKKVPWWMKIVRPLVVGFAIIIGADQLLLPNMPGRPLTKGEVAMVEPIFKNSIDYSKVKVSHTKATDLLRFVFRDAGMAHKNIIYAHDDTPDFSAKQLPFFTRYMFTHEMTHVWQYQNGVSDGPIDTVKRTLAKLNPWDKQLPTYVYSLKDGKDLTKFTVEQQASIVPDFNFIVKPAEAVKKDVQSPLDVDKFASPTERRAAMTRP
jgi:hypothetical protein